MKEYELKFTEDMHDLLKKSLKNKMISGWNVWYDENLALDNRFKNIKFTVFKDSGKVGEDSILLIMGLYTDNHVLVERLAVYSVEDKVLFSNKKAQLVKDYFDRFFEKIYLNKQLNNCLVENSNTQSKKKLKI